MKHIIQTDQTENDPNPFILNLPCFLLFDASWKGNGQVIYYIFNKKLFSWEI